jgi:hypothetical protein
MMSAARIADRGAMPAGNDVLSKVCVVIDFRCWIPDPDAT